MRKEMHRVIALVMAGVADLAAIYRAAIKVRPVGNGVRIEVVEQPAHPILGGLVAYVEVFPDLVRVGDELGAYEVYPDGTLAGPNGLVPVGEEEHLPHAFRFLLAWREGENEVEA